MFCFILNQKAFKDSTKFPYTLNRYHEGKNEKKEVNQKWNEQTAFCFSKFLFCENKKNSFWKVTSKNTKFFFIGFYDHHEHTLHIIFSCLLIFFHFIIIIVERCKEFFRTNFKILISKTSFFHYSKRKSCLICMGLFFSTKKPKKSLEHLFPTLIYMVACMWT